MWYSEFSVSSSEEPFAPMIKLLMPAERWKAFSLASRKEPIALNRPTPSATEKVVSTVASGRRRRLRPTSWCSFIGLAPALR